MTACVLMLRGINLGPSRRLAMPRLRAAFADAGYGTVRTYVQTGNIVLSSDRHPEELESAAAQLIAERFELDVPVVARTRSELAEVAAHNPLADVADDDRRYQVTFLAREPDPAVVERLRAAVTPPEAMAASRREIYAWHPGGIARSKLWNALGGKGLGVVATSRNWGTVTTLLAMAREIET